MENDRLISDLFDRAMSLAGEARQQFLEELRERYNDEVASQVRRWISHRQAPVDTTNDLQPLKEDHPYRIGDQLDQFRIESILTGGFSVVYVCSAESLDARFALKTLQDWLLKDPAVFKRFEQEAAILQKLGGHPFIVQAPTTLSFEGRPYIVMLYVESEPPLPNNLETLLQLSERKRRLYPHPLLADESTLTAMIQVCAAMRYAGARGVTAHGDIKPANILLQNRASAVMADFGIARSIDLQVRLSVAGTRGYVAPEVQSGQEPDVLSDIYSMGVVLYRLSTNHLELPTSLPALFVDHVPEPFSAVVKRCVHRRREERFSDFTQLQTALLEIADKLHRDGKISHSASDIAGLLDRMTGHHFENPEMEAQRRAADQLVAFGRFQEALPHLSWVIEQGSLELRVLYLRKRAHALLRLQRHKDALEDACALIAIDPEDFAALTNAFQAEIHLGNFAGAKAYLNKCRMLMPGDECLMMQEVTWARKTRDWKRALALLDESLVRNPRDPGVLCYKAEILCEIGAYQEADEPSRLAVELDPYHDVNLDMRAEVLEGLERWEEAAFCRLKEIEADPHCHAARLRATLDFLFAGHPGEARQQAMAAIQLDIRDPECLTLFSWALQQLDDPGAAHECFRRASEQWSRDQIETKLADFSRVVIKQLPDWNSRSAAESWYNRGVILSEEGDDAAAEDCYRQALRCWPGLAQASNNLATLLVKRGRNQEALLTYGEAIGRSPDNAIYRFNKGVLLQAIGQFEKAEQEYRAALRLDRELTSARFNLTKLLISLGRGSEAVRTLEQLLAIEPGDYRAWVELACLLLEQDDPESALASVDRALKITQTKVAVWHTRGVILHQMGRIEESLAAYHKAQSLDPNEPVSFYSEALIYEESNPSKAIDCYTEAIRRDPGYFEAIHNRAVLYENLGHIDHAIASYERLAAIVPRNEKPLLSLGSLLYRQKRFDEAIQVLEDAVELAPESPLASYKVGMALAAGGCKPKARAAFERAIQLAQSLPEKKRRELEDICRSMLVQFELAV